MKNTKLFKALKPLITTWQGWLAIAISTIFTFIPGWIPLLIGIITENETIINRSMAVIVFILTPIFPLWLILPTTSYAIYKLFTLTDN